MDGTVDTPLLVVISSKASLLFLVPIVMLVLFHVVFVWWRQLSAMHWKRVEYFWLFVAAMGLVSLAPQIRQAWLRPLVRVATFKAQFAFDDLMRSVNDGKQAICGTLSPDKASSLPGSACGDFVLLTQRISLLPAKDNEPSLPMLTGDDVRFAARCTDRTAQAGLIALQKAHEAYLTAFHKHRALQRDLLQRPEEGETLFMMPILVLLALAIRWTKVSGELRLARGGPGVVEMALRFAMKRALGLFRFGNRVGSGSANESMILPGSQRLSRVALLVAEPKNLLRSKA